MAELLEIARQSTEFRKLLRDKENGKLYHGYIIESLDAKYADAFIKATEMLFMCEKNGCGECNVCRKISAGVHVDVFAFPSGGRKIISAKDDIAIFRNAYAFKPLEGGARVFVFDSVSSVRDDWQNKMLKSLEEPVLGNYILIKTDGAERLLPTVRSRCELIRLSGLSEGETTLLLTKDGFDEITAQEASWLFDGNYTLSEAFVSGGTGRKITDELMGVLTGCRSSKDCVRYVSVLGGMKDDKDAFFAVISAIFRKLIGFYCGKEIYFRQREFETLKEIYSLKSAGEIARLLIKEKRRAEQNVSFQAIADDLLLSMMEVKYRCRQ